jgi:hypothetical protein
MQAKEVEIQYKWLEYRYGLTKKAYEVELEGPIQNNLFQLERRLISYIEVKIKLFLVLDTFRLIGVVESY